MPGIETALRALHGTRDLAAQDTPLHRLDPRAKVVTVLAFIVAVVSFGRYEVARLLPFVLFPAALAAVGRVPAAYLAKRLLAALPFVFFVAIFNPLFDREAMVRLGPVVVSSGWVSFTSIMLRFLLTVGAALVLVATTGIEALCQGLVRLRIPRVFVVQVLFMYRYLFVLVDEGARMVRAHQLRAPDHPRVRMRTFGSLVGHLLLRAFDRAQRIHTAMLSRGFDGEVRLLRSFRLRLADAAFVLGWTGFFVLARLFHLPRLLGHLVAGGSP
jgi:cobalt/nickel transport system permease protein